MVRPLRERRMSIKVRDFIERVLLFAFIGWFVYQLVTAIAAGETPWVSGLVLFGELVVLVLVFVRRPAADISQSWSAWLLAFGATAMPLFVIPHGVQLFPAFIVGILFMIGIVAQITAKLSLSRSFGIVPANRGVVTNGMYSIVRHPVYASYLVGHVAFLLANFSAWNAAVYAFALGLQIARILSEEDLLTRDPAYAAYRETVRYRLLPGVF
jgi:protein-S-isoprenylcysteine O-methyltransferase Ste14